MRKSVKSKLPSFRVCYIRFHNFVVRVGVSRLVCVPKWLGFVVSLVFTVGRIGEYFLLGKHSDLLYYSYFATLNTQVVVVSAAAYY